MQYIPYERHRLEVSYSDEEIDRGHSKILFIIWFLAADRAVLFSIDTTLI